MKKIILLVWFVIVAAFLGGPGLAAELTDVEEIVAKANLAAYYAGKDGRALVKMTITDSAGREREREFTILRFDLEDGGRQKFYVYFKQPSDVKGMVFMVHKFTEKDDDRWLYLPALDLVKRIAASDKRTSFVGSDFFYEDVSGRGLNEDEHRLLPSSGEFYVVENRPKNPDSVEFASYTVWVDKTTMLPRKAEYLDRQGQLYRRVEAVKIENVQGFPTVTESRVENLAAGSVTVSPFQQHRL